MRSTSVAIMPPKKVPKLLPGQRRINFCGKGEDNEEEPVRKEATERGGDTVTVTVAEAKVSEEPKTKPKRSIIEGWLATYKWLICAGTGLLAKTKTCCSGSNCILKKLTLLKHTRSGKKQKIEKFDHLCLSWF